MPNCNYNGYDFGMQGITTMFKADASNLVNSNGNKVVQAGKSLQGMYGNVAPTTVAETTVAPTTAPATKAATVDETPDKNAIQTGSAVPTVAILMVLLAGVAVAYYARRKNEM